MAVNSTYCQSITLIHFHQAATGGSEQRAGEDVRVHLRATRPHRDSRSFHAIIFPLSKYQSANAEVISEVAECTLACCGVTPFIRLSLADCFGVTLLVVV